MPLPVNAGLCGNCRHCRTLENRRGSAFVMCELAASDPTLRRYPRLPVLDCHGYDPLSSAETTSEGPLPTAGDTPE